MTTVKLCENQSEWDEWVNANHGHPLQLWGWGEVKSVHNWQAYRLFMYDSDVVIGAAQILKRTLPKPFGSLAYVPRGPVASEENRGMVLQAVVDFAKTTLQSVCVTIEPDWVVLPASADGWKQSENTILIPKTLILDLQKSEDELQSAMTKKTRQYIRKSASESIDIRQVKGREELDKCLDIYQATADRAGFALHGRQYYYDVFDMLGEHSPVFAAFSNGQPVAFLWLAISGETAFELYGGMNEEGQQLRANYALKWHAIQTTRRWGIKRYDFNGLLNDGVSTFKRGFAVHEDMLVGTFDYPLSPLYAVWSRGLPAAKKLIRTLKRR